MSPEDISEYLAYIPRETLERDLLSVEDEILHRINANVFALEACFRYVVMYILRRGALPGALPQRLLAPAPPEARTGGPRCGSTIRTAIFQKIVNRVADALRNMAMARIELTPVRNVKYVDNPDDERRRRAAIYAARAAEIDRTVKRWESNRGLKAMSVRCMSPRISFATATKAAEWASRRSGRNVTRAHIRTAIKRGTRCAGLKWAYDRRIAAIRRANAIAVHCIELKRSFGTISEAADFAGVSAKCMRATLAGNKALTVHRKHIEFGALTFIYDQKSRPIRGKQLGLFDSIKTEGKPRQPGLFDCLLRR